MGAGAGGGCLGRGGQVLAVGHERRGSGWLNEHRGQAPVGPGFLLKGQVGGVPAVELGFLGRRGVTRCPRGPGGSWSPHLTRYTFASASPDPHVLQAVPQRQRLTTSLALHLAFCDLAPTPPGLSPFTGMAEGGSGLPGPLGLWWQAQPSHKNSGRSVPCPRPLHAVPPGQVEVPTNPAQVATPARSGTICVHGQMDGHTQPSKQGRVTRP